MPRLAYEEEISTSFSPTTTNYDRFVRLNFFPTIAPTAAFIFAGCVSFIILGNIYVALEELKNV